MTETRLAPLDDNGYSREDLELIKEQIAQGATDAELRMFLAVCRRTGLDPLKRQIYFYRRTRGAAAIIHVGVDGLRLIAERSGKWEGSVGPLWCGPDGKWREVWLEEDPPAAAKFGLYRQGCREAIWAVATWRSSVQENSPLWQQRGPEMLGKTAESWALRRAFPSETAGLMPEGAGRVDCETGEVIESAPESETEAAALKRCNDFFHAAAHEAGIDTKDRPGMRRLAGSVLGREVVTVKDVDAADLATVGYWIRENPEAARTLAKGAPQDEGVSSASMTPASPEAEDDAQRLLRLGAVQAAERGPYAQQMGI